jgi:hypothetical protein
MSSLLSELPVQPYDNMASVLIEYDVRVQLVCKILASSTIIGGNISCLYGCSVLLKGLVSFFSLGRMSLKVKVHNPCRV